MAQRFTKSLRFRFLTALGGVLLLALIALVVLSKWFIFPALHNEERIIIDQEMDRLERSLQLSQQELLAQARDWAIWDDSYEFVQGNYSEYAEVNFSQQMFEEMRYQLMAFFDADGEVYFIAGVNPSSGHYQACSSLQEGCRWMTPLISAMQASIQEDPQQSHCILYAGTPPLMVASNPILRTDESGPPVGWLFKVRPMDTAWLELIEGYTGLPAAVSMLENKVGEEDAITITGNTILAERYLTAFPGNSKIVLGTQLNRTSYLSSLKTFRYVLIWTASLMLLVIALVLFLLDRMILKPLRALTKFSQRPHSETCDADNLTQRGDEIGLLARAFQNQFQRQQELNAELLELSTHDALTGLPNRRLFDQRLEEAINHALINNQSLSVMMLDIDHFKLFNDYYGHAEGDVCLQQAAQSMQNVAKASSFFIARTGGEEFSAIFPEASSLQAVQKCMSLSDAIDQLEIPHQLSPVASHLTVSIGISQLTHDELTTPGILMKTADQALYEAKAAGRHCAKVYTPSSADVSFSSPKQSP